MRVALGIDLASGTWADNGSAELVFDDAAFFAVVPAAVRWPVQPLTPAAMAVAIDRHARDRGVWAVSLDGPQGWRDPRTPEGTPGVGRRCEYECRTQGKTGPYGVTYPGTQRPWIEFSIAVFDELLRKPGVTLAKDSHGSKPTDGYIVLECFPTSTWRTSGLDPLPGKSKRSDLRPFVESLTSAYHLPVFSLSSHDDLQAVVAALSAAGVAGGPVTAIPRGRVAADAVCADQVVRRAEGLIWDAQPREGPVRAMRSRSAAKGTRTAVASEEPALPVAPRLTPVATTRRWAEGSTACVTAGILEQLRRTQNNGAMMIALRGVPGGTKAARRKVLLVIDGDEYVIIVGDSHAAWRSHQTSSTMKSFETLFRRLSELPGEWMRIERASTLAD